VEQKTNKKYGMQDEMEKETVGDRATARQARFRLLNGSAVP
jgi:hypothetical protein